MVETVLPAGLRGMLTKANKFACRAAHILLIRNKSHVKRRTEPA